MHFSWYGFIIGLALVTFYLVFEFLINYFADYQPGGVKKFLLYRQAIIWQCLVISLLLAVVGARSWHVIFNWQYYAQHSNLIWQTWRGGISIIGALVFGLLSFYCLLIYRLISPNKTSTLAQKLGFGLSVVKFLFDCLALSIPVAQIIGRLGNYVNQELYGLPTSLPWGIHIDLANRPSEFLAFSKFHPLFLYEMLLLALLLFCFYLFFLWKKKMFKQLFGQGTFFTIYIVYYATARFVLDFLRIDKEIWQVAGYQLSVVQWFLLSFLLLMLCYGLFKKIIYHWLFKTRALHFQHSETTEVVLKHEALIKKHKHQVFQKQNCYFLTALLIINVVLFGLMYLSKEKNLFSKNYLNQSAKQPSVYQLLKNVPDRSLVGIELAKQKMLVEVVNTPASITQGLSGRQTIGADGMLFVLPAKTQATFWMKDMLFDLDLLWIANDGVVEITNNATKPPTNTALNDLPRYQPKLPVEMVLEIEAGKNWANLLSGVDQQIYLHPMDNFNTSQKVPFN